MKPISKTCAALTCVTLFAGFGGKTLGAVRCGFTPVLAVEYDEQIAAVYRKNFPGCQVIVAPVQSVGYESFRGVGLLLVSPPCPSFSVANANGGETEEDIAMAQAVCRAIREMMPRAIFLENVRGYLKSKSFALICTTLDELGYSYDFGVYDAADYGVPQNRQRLILRGLRDLGRDTFMQVPMPPLPPKVTKRTGWYEAIADLIPTLKETRLADWQVKRLPAELLSSVMVEPNADNDWFKAREADKPSGTVYASQNKISAILLTGLNRTGEATVSDASSPSPTMTIQLTGDRPSHMPRAVLIGDQKQGTSSPNVQARQSDRTKGGLTASDVAHPLRAVLCSGALVHDGMTTAWDKDPALTITNTDKRPQGAFILPDGTVSGGRVVALDTRCVARLQTFPDSFLFSEKRSVDATGIGNAVPPLMAEAFIRSIGVTK